MLMIVASRRTVCGVDRIMGTDRTFTSGLMTLTSNVSIILRRYPLSRMCCTLKNNYEQGNCTLANGDTWAVTFI